MPGLRAGQGGRAASMAVTIPAYTDGYVQTVHPEPVLQTAEQLQATVQIAPVVGEHVVAGRPIAHAWRTSPEQSAARPRGVRGRGSGRRPDRLLTPRPLGDYQINGSRNEARVIIRAPSFADYAELACGLIRRYGAAEPTVTAALVVLLQDAQALVTDPDRMQVLSTRRGS